MHTPAWVSDAIFYQIFPDRFAQSKRISRRGLHLEQWESPPTTYGFKGGDLYGVIEHLDYLQDLGVNAIYFNPVFSSASNHRYHTYDYRNVDPLLGGNKALRELLDKAHKRRMHIVLDGVFNHASRGFWQFHHTLENGAASPYKDWFFFDNDHLMGRRHWGAYPSPEEQRLVQQEGSLKALGYQAWWNLAALPKFDTSRPAVREFIFEIAEYWVKFGIDGWRLDVPGEINDDSFWQEFRRRVRDINPDAYLVGEIWNDASRWLQGDQFDASMNYMVTCACLSFFPGRHLDLGAALQAGGFQGMVNPIDAGGFAERINSILGLYKPKVTRSLLNLLDSHDTPRFLTCASHDKASLRLALAFILTYPGAPCIFYGDEIGLAGYQDPDCRQPFPWDESKWDHDLRNYVKALCSLRSRHKALRVGDFEHIYARDNVYAFIRKSANQTLLVALNVDEQVRTLETSLADGTRGRQKLLFGQADIKMKKKMAQITIPSRSAAVLKI
jgi:cyclomaltodextrinase / maltogenic alpha-amylase / neopullulanase